MMIKKTPITIKLPPATNLKLERIKAELGIKKNTMIERGIDLYFEDMKKRYPQIKQVLYGL